MVHLATLVASSYRHVPTLAESVVVLTHLGKGISSTTSSTETGPLRPGITSEHTGFCPTAIEMRPWPALRSSDMSICGVQYTGAATCDCVFTRYRMSSNSPSGGTNETTRSRSKRFMRTHGWNEQSSITSGSRNVNVRSGMPERREFACTIPETSDETIWPALSTMAST